MTSTFCGHRDRECAELELASTRVRSEPLDKQNPGVIFPSSRENCSCPIPGRPSVCFFSMLREPVRKAHLLASEVLCRCSEPLAGPYRCLPYQFRNRKRC